MREYKAKIKKITKLSDNARHFVLKLTKPKEIDFEAGQYVIIKIPGDTPLFRSYSIFSSPEKKNKIELCVTFVEGGKASEYFFKKCEIGDELEMRGPLGILKLEEAPEYVFIASGSGVAPFYPMALEILKNNPEAKINFFFSLRYAGDVFLRKELEKLKKKYPNFNYLITITRPDETWKGATGRINLHLEKLGNFQNKKYYLCGSTNMINDLSEILKQKGVNESDIRFERFY